MNKVISKEHFSEKVVKLVVKAPMIAASRRPGHFVIVRVGDGGERIPLTIADADIAAGTITLVVQNVGISTAKICALEPGDMFTDVVGPGTSHQHSETRHRGVLRRWCRCSPVAPHHQSHETGRQPRSERACRPHPRPHHP